MFYLKIFREGVGTTATSSPVPTLCYLRCGFCTPPPPVLLSIPQGFHGFPTASGIIPELGLLAGMDCGKRTVSVC